jgi:hypothetical protein
MVATAPPRVLPPRRRRAPVARDIRAPDAHALECAWQRAFDACERANARADISLSAAEVHALRQALVRERHDVARLLQAFART